MTPFAIGLGGISGIRFFICNAIGGAGWSVAVAFVGYLFGAIAEAILVDVKRYEHWIIPGLLCAGAFVWFIYFMHKRAKRRLEP